MKKINWLAFLLVAAFAFTTVSCNDDDKINCDTVEDQLDDLNEDLEDAIDEGDCDEIESIYSKAFSILRKGKNCEYVTELLDVIGYDNVEDFIDELEDERDAILDDLGC